MTHTPYPTGQSAYPTQPPAFPAYPTQVSGVTGPPSHSYNQPPPYPQLWVAYFQTVFLEQIMNFTL